MKKNIIIIIVLVLSLILIFIDYARDFKIKDINIEAGTNLSNNLKNYSDTNKLVILNKKIDISEVNTEINGTYKYYVTINNRTKEANITVKDTKKPKVEIRDLYIKKGEPIVMSDFVTYYEDVNDKYGIKYDSSFDKNSLNKEGTYKLKFSIVDINGNETECVGNIIVVDWKTYHKESVEDLSFYRHNSKNRNLIINNIEEKYYYKPSKAIDTDSAEYFIGLDINKIKQYLKDKYPEYKFNDYEEIVAYNKYNYAIGFLARLTITKGNETKEIYLHKGDI